MYHEQIFPCFFQVQENSWTWRTQVSRYGKRQNILLRIPLKSFWSIMWPKSSWNLGGFFCSECNHDQVIRCMGKLFFPFFPPIPSKGKSKIWTKLWPKNQDVNPYSQEMCAGTNKHVIVWDNQPHMCTGFFTPSRSTWPLDVESTPQAIVSLMRVCDSESSKRCDWWQWLHSPQLLWHLDNMNQLSK